MPTDLIRAPWTGEQVTGLNAYQKNGQWHPFTCGNHDCPAPQHASLRATPDGWVCDFCDYTQDWAHAFMPEMGLNPPKPWWET